MKTDWFTKILLTVFMVAALFVANLRLISIGEFMIIISLLSICSEINDFSMKFKD